MARFVQLLKKSGVYSNQNFMIVPSNGFNLVALLDAKDFRIEHDARLDVKEVRMDDVDRIANEYVAKRATGPEKSRSRAAASHSHVWDCSLQRQIFQSSEGIC